MIIFNVEEWLYRRKDLYPNVDCVDGSASKFWKSFNYHAELSGIVIQPNDIIVDNRVIGNLTQLMDNSYPINTTHVTLDHQGNCTLYDMDTLMYYDTERWHNSQYLTIDELSRNYILLCDIKKSSIIRGDGFEH